jgi:hypothetical protein
MRCALLRRIRAPSAADSSALRCASFLLHSHVGETRLGPPIIRPRDAPDRRWLARAFRQSAEGDCFSLRMSHFLCRPAPPPSNPTGCSRASNPGTPRQRCRRLGHGPSLLSTYNPRTAPAAGKSRSSGARSRSLVSRHSASPSGAAEICQGAGTGTRRARASCPCPLSAVDAVAPSLATLGTLALRVMAGRTAGSPDRYRIGPLRSRAHIAGGSAATQLCSPSSATARAPP